MNIITSDILTTEYDIFWQDAGSYLEHLSPAPVLAITETLQPGSAEHTLLLKMLEACKLTPAQYNIVSVPAKSRVAWHKMCNALQPKVVLLLGMMPASLGVSALMKYCEYNHFDQAIWLPGPSAASMVQQPPVKIQYWNNALKPLFLEGAHGDVLAL